MIRLATDPRSRPAGARATAQADAQGPGQRPRQGHAWPFLSPSSSAGAPGATQRPAAAGPQSPRGGPTH